jgi:hypothetical protein
MTRTPILGPVAQRRLALSLSKGAVTEILE